MPGAPAPPPGPARPVDAYLEHAPPAALASYIQCFWSRTSPAHDPPTSRSHRVMPDGCVDVLAALGEDSASTLAVGAMTRPVLFHDTSSVSYLGVRLRPGVAGVLFDLPASELTDERPPLAEVWADAEALGEALALARDTAARIRVLSAAIARRILAAPAPAPAVVTAAVGRLASMDGNVSIRALAAELGVTRQHLARSFAQHVGVSPKMLARIVRARGVVARARAASDVDWSSVALDAGYYDQSHLIADVKALTGLPPSAWVARRA